MVRYALGGPSVFYQNRGIWKLIGGVGLIRQNCYREKVNTFEHPWMGRVEYKINKKASVLCYNKSNENYSIVDG